MRALAGLALDATPSPANADSPGATPTACPGWLAHPPAPPEIALVTLRAAPGATGGMCGIRLTLPLDLWNERCGRDRSTAGPC